MTICNWCKNDMLYVDSCNENTYVKFPDGRSLPSAIFHFDEPSGRCHDCNVKHGEHHHPGCDVEKCPRCDGQLISCGCLNKDEEGDVWETQFLI